MSKVAVLGAGAWGTALAIHLARHKNSVVLWAHKSSHAEQLSLDRENAAYLSGYAFPEQMTVTADLSKALDSVDAVLVVVPSTAFSDTLNQIHELGRDIPHIAWATKGFDPNSQKLLHEIAISVFQDKVHFAVLSGPTFADEVAKGLPTAMVAASSLEEEAGYWVDLFHEGTLRMYPQQDVPGVEVGGAYKNIMAIATGVSDGLCLGANARAALVSRGMAEMQRFGAMYDARSETLMGLAGLGDLVLTCTDDLSRNRRFGLELARSDLGVEGVIKCIGQVVEGVKAVKVIVPIARRKGVELPIAEQVYRLVHSEITPEQAAKNLLAREVVSEG